MEAKLKKGTTITATHTSSSFWILDDTITFTDTTENITQPIYTDDGQKLYFPKLHDFASCGFPENMFDTNY